MAKLGEVCKVSPSTKNIKRQSAWLLNLDMVEQQTGRVIEYKYAGEDDLNGSIIQFDTENVLYSKLRPNLNKVVLPEKDGFSTSELLPLRPDASVLNRDYLAVFLRSDSFVTWAVSKTAGAKMPRLGTKDLMNAEIPVPNIERQKEIAEKFKKLEQLISLRKQQLAKLDELVKARFVEMFGDINVNNKKWMTYPLGELCTIVRGGSPRPIERYLGGTIPWIKIGDATTGENIYLNSTKEYIIQEGVKKSRMIKAGSLIFANCGVSLGFARIITFDGCIHDGWLAMEDIDEKLDKIFLLYSLNQMTEYFRKTAPAGTQPNLNTNIMKMHRQIVPPMEMQKAFISFVKCADRQKQIVQQSLEKLELMKKALMQEYFG